MNIPSVFGVQIYSSAPRRVNFRRVENDTLASFHAFQNVTLVTKRTIRRRKASLKSSLKIVISYERSLWGMSTLAHCQSCYIQKALSCFRIAALSKSYPIHLRIRIPQFPDVMISQGVQVRCEG